MKHWKRPRPVLTDQTTRAEVDERVINLRRRAERVTADLARVAERNQFADRWRNAMRGTA